jgi:thioredoxin 1
MTIREYLPEEKVPTRDEIDGMTGPVLVEFGTPWCGYCQAAQRDIVPLLAEHPQVKHVKVEDGPGRRLGRSFRVKLWPNLVFMKDGVVVRQLARPGAREMREAFQALVGGSPRSENPSDLAT